MTAPRDFPHELVLETDYSVDQAQLIATSLEPELGDLQDDRSHVSLDRQGGSLTLVIAANDLVALRAALNTWLDLVKVADELSAPR